MTYIIIMRFGNLNSSVKGTGRNSICFISHCYSEIQKVGSNESLGSVVTSVLMAVRFHRMPNSFIQIGWECVQAGTLLGWWFSTYHVL